MKNILALSFAGVFFFCFCSLAGSLELATALFENNEWALCRRECTRALLAGTEPAEHFQLMAATASVREGAPTDRTATRFQLIIATNRNPQVSAMAAYELGRIQWQMEQPEAALEAFAFSFQTTTNKALFLHSACSLFLLLEEHRTLRQDREDLVSQINTSRDQWYGALFSECAKPDPAKNRLAAPSWLIRFYRSQISPAIGNRCVLEPSCSEYFHQAYCKHSILAVPMIADRFFREPGVSNTKDDPVIMPNGQIRYRDPIENHDFWMNE